MSSPDLARAVAAAVVPPVGLSHAHNPSSAPLRGEYRHGVEWIPYTGPPVEVVTALGPCVLTGTPDRWVSVRRWSDGISVGSGLYLDASRNRRGVVRELSRGACSRMLRYLRECEAKYQFFGTLTLPAEYGTAKQVRVAIDRWLVAAMREQQRAALRGGRDPKECGIFWFVEFQDRGAPHLHCFYTNFVHWEVLAGKWASAVRGSGAGYCEDWDGFARTSTRFERFRYGFRGVMGYARKYAGKQEQKTAPDGYWVGRFWGVRGLRTLGSCHILGVKGRSEGVRVLELANILDQLHEQGILRKWRWEYGDGAVYTIRSGRSWSEIEQGVDVERAVLAVLREVLENDRCRGSVTTR